MFGLYLILNFQVVHTCSDLLHNCYTLEEIEETKLGQLELMRKVFLDLINDTKWVTVEAYQQNFKEK